MDVATILSLVEFAISEEPQVAASLKNIFSKTDPTPADWQAERDALAKMTYNSEVPNSSLPPETPPATP